MKNSLFIAAVVLFCTQVLDAIPCTTCNNGGIKTVTTTKTFTPVTYVATSGNKFGTNVNGGQNVANFQTTSSNSNMETFIKNFGQNGKTETVFNWSAGGKGGNDNDSSNSGMETFIKNFGENGKTVTVTNWSAGGKGGNDNDSSNPDIETIRKNLNFGQNGKTETVFNWTPGGKGGNDNDNNGQRGNGGNNNNWHAEWNFENGNAGCKTCQGNGNNNGNDDCKTKLQAEIAKNLMLQREIDSLKNLMSKQENKLNQLNVQWNTCNSNNNQLTIVVNQLKQTNINLELKVQQSQTTIINLTKNVQQMTIVNKGNENTLIELKHNYDILLVKFENCQKNVAELTSSNTNLKKKNQEMNITINQLTSSNSELSAKYSALQQSSQTVQLKLSNCERENKILEESLAFEVDKYEKDEKDDVLRELRLQKTTSELKECKVELSSLQKLYISEQANSAKCIDEVVSIKIELKTTITNYETTIYNLNITITKLEFSLQAEVDIKNTYILANEKCELINIDNTKKVELLTQALSDAESQTESCRADLVISISNYQASLITIENQTEQLKGCGSVASTIQLDLAECEAKLDNCSNELTGVTIHLTEVENKNIQLGDENLELADSLQQCDDDRSSLRCTANKGFGTIQESENAIRPILKSFIDTINNLKADRETFETVNDIRCPYT